MHEPVVALIVAEPGRLRDAWRALLLAMPGIATVTVAGDGPAALTQVDVHHPTVVLVDGDLRGGAASVLVAQIKRAQPGTRCIALACCTGHELEAAALWADAVLVKGFAADKLFETVSRVLLET